MKQLKYIIIFHHENQLNNSKKWIYLNFGGNLCYSRVEVASDTRHSVRCCGHPPLLRCNEADGARSARPKGERCRHNIICHPSKYLCMGSRRIL